MSWNKERILLFIEKYRSLECLWKIKCKDYSNKLKKDAAYRELVSFVQEYEPTANKESVSKKINNLRTAYRKELKKVLDSQRSGAGADEIYSPTLWYFEHLTFLYEQEVPRKGTSSLDFPSETDSQDDVLPSEDITDIFTQEEQDDGNTDSSALSDSSRLSPNPSTSGACSPNQTSRTTPGRKNLKRKKNPSEELMSEISAKLRSVEPDDQHDVFGRHVASQLRTMEKTQNILAVKLINEVLFEGQMNNLTRNAFMATNVVEVSQSDI